MAETVPETGTSQHMQYELYAAGLDAVTATLDVRDAKTRYNVTLAAGTRGLLGRIVPWDGTFYSEGADGPDGKVPSLHRSTAKSGKGDELKNYVYANGGVTSYKVFEKGKDVSPKTVDPALGDHTIDALTAAIDVMNLVAAGKPCAGQSEIFDGERRYRLVFHDLGAETLSASRINIYQGPAEKCVAEVVPVAGNWHKKPRGWMSIQEQGRKLGTLPAVWFARMEPDAPAVPVRMQVVTDYGTLLMHLVAYNNDKQPQTKANNDKAVSDGKEEDLHGE